MMAEALPILVAEGVTSGYGEVPVVEDVSIHVGQDEIVTIIGPNGAGKSTVLKALFGFLPVWQGRVSLAGNDVTGLAPRVSRPRRSRSGQSVPPSKPNKTEAGNRDNHSPV